MEIASNKGVIADASTPAGRAGMSESEWREAIKFDSTDTGWVIMSIGMAIGAGIVFLPVQVGLMGLWVFLLSSVIGYPAMYLFQRLFINTLAESPVKRRTKSAKAFQIKYENSNFRASIETVVLCMSVSFTFICLKNIHIISDIKIFS